MTTPVGIINTRSANFRSVFKALQAAGAEPRIVSSAEDLREVPAAVLPGVGHAATAINNILQSGLYEPLRKFAFSGHPLLGVCVGMQLLYEASEEGNIPGLTILEGRVVRMENFPTPTAEGQRVKIPHIGWNNLIQGPANKHPLFRHLQGGEEFYFVHSYHCVPKDPEQVAATVVHGNEICAAAASGNVAGVQFHPEKSAENGLRMYRSFVRWVESYNSNGNGS